MGILYIIGFVILLLLCVGQLVELFTGRTGFFAFLAKIAIFGGGAYWIFLQVMKGV